MDNQDTAQCSTKKEGCKKGYCPIRCFLLPVLAVFAAIFAFEWVFHGVIMMPSYQATAALWRSHTDMQDLCYVSLIRQVVTALVVTCLFCWISKVKSDCGTPCCPIQKGAKFGFKIGLLLGIGQFGSYVYLPIPLNMALAWLAGGVAEGVLMGVVLGTICRMKGNTGDMGTA